MRDLERSHLIGKARLLRREGKTYDEIRAAIGPISNDMLRLWMKGIARPPETNRTGRAMPEERRKARELRAQGLTITEISEFLGVSKGTISPWIRDVTAPRRESPARRERHMLARQAAARKLHERAVARSEAASASALRDVGELSDRELLLVGAALYWAEGTKEKPWRRSGRVIFINSDVTVLRVFLRWLDLVGVTAADRCYRLNIHESAEVATHEQWWAAQLGLGDVEFQRATIKRHNPKPSRHNRGDSYHGCLTVSVRRSRALYDSITGWWAGIAAG
ncbi:MAG TPA: hypothetical protein VHB69_07545 [Mycobacteriales bacterium]|nr:hypothetical protein [Mycobacteriales bacterium]